MTAGRNEAEVAGTVKFALDLGINVIDCRDTYGTERAVGLGLKGRDRDALVVSTKFYVRRNETIHKPAEVVAGLDESLSLPGIGHLDIFFLHGITPASYGHAVVEIVPALRREQEMEKFRFLGLTEGRPGIWSMRAFPWPSMTVTSTWSCWPFRPPTRTPVTSPFRAPWPWVPELNKFLCVEDEADIQIGAKLALESVAISPFICAAPAPTPWPSCRILILILSYLML